MIVNEGYKVSWTSSGKDIKRPAKVTLSDVQSTLRPFQAHFQYDRKIYLSVYARLENFVTFKTSNSEAILIPFVKTYPKHSWHNFNLAKHTFIYDVFMI